MIIIIIINFIYFILQYLKENYIFYEKRNR